MDIEVYVQYIDFYGTSLNICGVIIFFCNNTKTRFLIKFHKFNVNIIFNKNKSTFI